jgi:chromosome segregation ATPase
MKKFMTAAAKTVNVSGAEQALMDAEKLYQEQQNAKKVVEEQHDQLTANTQKIADAIQALYNENGGLIRRAEELTKQQKELLQLKEEYSEDNLESLRSQVARLQEDSDYLKEQYSTLDKQTAETLGQLADTLEKIGQLSKVHFKATESSRKEAEEFKTAIEVFCQTNEEYQSWFRGIQSPLQAMEKMVGKAEARALRGVMTRDELKQKNELVARVDQDLTRLNRLAIACAKAAGKDYSTVIAESQR